MRHAVEMKGELGLSGTRKLVSCVVLVFHYCTGSLTFPPAALSLIAGKNWLWGYPDLSFWLFLVGCRAQENPFVFHESPQGKRLLSAGDKEIKNEMFPWEGTS